MAENEKDRKVFPANMVRLCVDGYDEDIKGRIYSKLIAGPIVFDNCCEMLMKADEMFAKAGYPQAFCETRSFAKDTVKAHYDLPGEPLSDDEELQKQEGQLCTLDVLISSRRQASWQGIIRSVQDSRTKEFYCGMELLRCIEKIIGNHNLQAECIK